MSAVIGLPVFFSPPHGVRGGDDHVRADDTVRLELRLRHGIRPCHPLAVLYPNLCTQRARSKRRIAKTKRWTRRSVVNTFGPTFQRTQRSAAEHGAERKRFTVKLLVVKKRTPPCMAEVHRVKSPSRGRKLCASRVHVTTSTTHAILDYQVHTDIEAKAVPLSMEVCAHNAGKVKGPSRQTRHVLEPTSQVYLSA